MHEQYKPKYAQAENPRGVDSECERGGDARRLA